MLNRHEVRYNESVRHEVCVSNRHEVHYNDIMSQIDMRYIIHVTIGSNRQCVEES